MTQPSILQEYNNFTCDEPGGDRCWVANPSQEELGCQNRLMRIRCGAGCPGFSSSSGLPCVRFAFKHPRLPRLPPGRLGRVSYRRMGVDMIFIFLLALILFGPKRLPEIAREVGKFMAEFKRASNDFKYQLQAEIDKASAPAAPPSTPGAQQSSASTGVVLPPSTPAPAAPMPAEDAETEHQRLMRTARMAFEAQNFTLRPPEPAPIAHASPQPAEQSSPSDSASAQPAAEAAPASDSAVQRS